MRQNTGKERWWQSLDQVLRLWSEECAQGIAEYGLILGLIVLAILMSFEQMVKAFPTGIKPVSDKLSE